MTAENEEEWLELESTKQNREDAVRDFLMFKKEISKWTEMGYELISITSDNWRTEYRTTGYLIKKE